MNRARATLALALALGAAVAACDCGGGGGAPLLWVGLRGVPRVASFSAAGAALGVAAEAPVLDAPVRALLRRRDGAVVALQEPEACAGGALDLAADACVPASAPRVAVPPAVLLSTTGERLAAFAGTDGAGAPLFTSAAPPWAAAEVAGGEVWVTGGAAPVVYAPGGGLVRLAEALPYATRGIAALPDGRVVVSYGVQTLAIYDATGAVVSRLEPALGPDYEGIDGLAADASGALLVATRRFGVTAVAVVLRARLEAGALVLAQDPALSVALPGEVPSALVLAGGRIATAPSLARLAGPACGRWLSADLRQDLGCAVPAPHLGLAWIDQ